MKIRSKPFGKSVLNTWMVVACLFISSGSSVAEKNIVDLDWKAPLAQSHPLVGAIHDSEGSMTVAALADLMARSRFILIGEKHDNADHHQLELYLLKLLLGQMASVNAQSTVAVTFEMLNKDQQSHITKVVDTLATSDDLQIEADELKTSLNWPERGWLWADYSELISWTLNNRLSVYAGSISKKTMRTIYQSGIDDRFETAKRLKADLNDAMLDQVFAGHCELMPRESLGAMVDVQLVKDSAMANALFASGGQHSVLVAGTGHIRKDTSVPLHLQLMGNQSVLTVALVEVGLEDKPVADYGYLFNRFDIIIFTPVANQRDYCADLKKSMHKE